MQLAYIKYYMHAYDYMYISDSYSYEVQYVKASSS